ncbi:hypothetical protein LPJ78_001667 [Coemansia sp. RSA 989]|nr:hypothetical protein BX667DRAFT_518223 [Coemansia mojavensis]KAJ1741165.1 hypothetical protein LPJ68_003096 [Coemansia sp. RSA 1086]KAJ1751943.1 hypothetical protein LPJ79_001674 [Coemansia sp. RSA 1821]KAJ1866608.1 hypothetical protein LPJ78_001667 [Coemansia sp. RSA 989]KAJ2632920.1 hypothetical protein H4R22_000869 [Coemansia sp. RSA 1290]KAJ2670352.1 hypothetical protein IWW42_004054 [Coemansia sp. RSA 1085]
MSNDNTNYSTLSNVKDKIVGSAKSALGNLSNNPEMKQEGDQQYYTAEGKQKVYEQQQEAEKKKEEMKNDPSFQQGQGLVQQIEGAGKKVLGGLTNDEKAKKEGEQKHAEGLGRFNANAEAAKQEKAKQEKAKGSAGQKEKN